MQFKQNQIALSKFDSKTFQCIQMKTFVKSIRHASIFKDLDFSSFIQVPVS